MSVIQILYATLIRMIS